MKSLAPVHIEGRKLPWKVDLSAKQTGTRRKRFFFASEPEALKFIIYYRENGLATAEAMVSQGYVNLDPSAQSGATVREAWASWLTRSAKLGAKTQAQYRYIGKLFKEKYGARALSSITHRDIDQWLNEVGGSESHQYNCFRIVRRFFEYCRNWQEIIPRNPAAKIEIEKPEGKKGILTPEEMKLIIEKIRKVDSPPLLAWAALGGYCGLRTSEILRATWEDFDWKGKEIHVIPKKTRGGLRERYVEILPTAETILRPLAGKGPIVPWNDKNFRIHRDKILEELRKVDARRWSSWPNNCLRHSAATYHLAKFQDAGRTAQFLGHTNPQTTHHDYARAAKRADAAAWWGDDAIPPQDAR